MGATQQAIRTFLLSNELTRADCRLRQLIEWLTEIAADFEAHGIPAGDLRAVMRSLDHELTRRARLRRRAS